MNIWNIGEEKRVMIIQILFENEINEGLKVPRKTNLYTFSAEWFSFLVCEIFSTNRISVNSIGFHCFFIKFIPSINIS